MNGQDCIASVWSEHFLIEKLKVRNSSIPPGAFLFLMFMCLRDLEGSQRIEKFEAGLWEIPLYKGVRGI